MQRNMFGSSTPSATYGIKLLRRSYNKTDKQDSIRFHYPDSQQEFGSKSDRKEGFEEKKKKSSGFINRGHSEK